jgi:hypothetical protein
MMDSPKYSKPRRVSAVRVNGLAESAAAASENLRAVLLAYDGQPDSRAAWLANLGSAWDALTKPIDQIFPLASRPPAEAVPSDRVLRTSIRRTAGRWAGHHFDTLTTTGVASSVVASVSRN